MRFKNWLAAVFAIIGIAISNTGFAVPSDQQDANGWSFPSLGAGKGTWDASVGVFVWNNTLNTRNLQVRGDVDLAPGIRLHSVIRSNREQDTLKGFKPHFDENYIEGYGFYHQPGKTLSASLRVGKIRYLHFPYPDSIAIFDQVPGISDLKGEAATGYSGELLTLEYEMDNGFGTHFSGINWGFGQVGGYQTLEDYLFYRHNLGKLRFETHIGGLAIRPEPLGRRANGYDVFLGTNSKGYTVGLLYEKLHEQPAYTGVMVTFPLNATTKALGSVAFDYDRDPEGFATQIPLAKGTIGGIKKKAPVGAILVGEIVAERLRTYWQNGQVRNYYEHRLSSWGETGQYGMIVVMKEEPWYLQAEALVSPHTFSDGVKTWEKDRQGPAQLSQRVVYKFYRQTIQ